MGLVEEFNQKYNYEAVLSNRTIVRAVNSEFIEEVRDFRFIISCSS